MLISNKFKGSYYVLFEIKKFDGMVTYMRVETEATDGPAAVREAWLDILTIIEDATDGGEHLGRVSGVRVEACVLNCETHR